MSRNAAGLLGCSSALGRAPRLPCQAPGVRYRRGGMRNVLPFFLMLLLTASGACAQQTTPPPANPPAASPALPDSPDLNVKPTLQPTGPTAVFDTSMGRMVCGLFAKEAPNTVANFVGLADGTKDWTDPATHAKEHAKPLYNGTTFHRVIPGFMVQGGDPTATGMGDPGYMFPDEIVPDLTFNVAGRLAMANSGPNTNGSQFFITEQPYPSLDGNYTIFGQCTPSSVSVVAAITHVERDGQDKPLSPVTLDKVTIVPAGQPLPAAPAGQPATGSSPGTGAPATGSSPGTGAPAPPR